MKIANRTATPVVTPSAMPTVRPVGIMSEACIAPCGASAFGWLVRLQWRAIVVAVMS